MSSNTLVLLLVLIGSGVRDGEKGNITISRDKQKGKGKGWRDVGIEEIEKI